MNPYSDGEVELLREDGRQERASMQMLASVIARGDGLSRERAMSPGRVDDVIMALCVVGVVVLVCLLVAGVL